MPLAEFRDEYGSNIEKVLLANISARLQVPAPYSRSFTLQIQMNHLGSPRKKAGACLA